MQLDRFLCKQSNYSRKTVLQLLSKQQIKINGVIATSRDTPVSEFSQIEVAGNAIYSPPPAQYFMLNKPAGFLSATKDEIHPTALELLTGIVTTDLHIAGRLDRATTGLLILTNDGKWSRRLTELKGPDEKQISKVYLVETAYAISPETPQRFAEGVYFEYENTTTSPAQIEMVSEKLYRLTIYEGRYHQVKRMFATVGNRVVNLHRESIGRIKLDDDLKKGEFRPLSPNEIDWI
ncbi:MAG: 16S rRNA pseudouridine516 synthase [Thiomicrorhabdus sp.]|nr:MAG: 16S rRNA pseudouridine516 synthase [Thiomicrorhabdus sp.]